MSARFVLPSERGGKLCAKTESRLRWRSCETALGHAPVSARARAGSTLTRRRSDKCKEATKTQTSRAREHDCRTSRHWSTAHLVLTGRIQAAQPHLEARARRRQLKEECDNGAENPVARLRERADCPESAQQKERDERRALVDEARRRRRRHRRHCIDIMMPGYAFAAALAVFAVACLLRQTEANASPSSRKINLREKEKQILDKILGPAHYDRRIRPSAVNGTDGPTVVQINLMFRGFSAISDNKMEISTIVTFREEWYDDRLKFDDMQGRMKYLTLNDPSKVWMPDLFFANEREGHFHNIIVPNVYVRIFPTGFVLYSIRLSLTLSCPMDLKLFPLDQQTCSLRMASYGWTTDDLVFLWRKDDPVQITRNLMLPRFALVRSDTATCNSKTNTGEYTCLKVDLVFRREFSYYLITIYIPCCMLVIVSWVSFWLDANAVPARVSLGVTTLLTMATQTTGINNSLPPVSYTKAIDVWTGVCLTFVFGALLEFALVNYASRSDAHREKLKKQRKQWEMEHQAALEAMAADGLLDDRNSFAMKPLVPASTEIIFVEDGRERPQQRNEVLQPETCCRSWLASYTLRSKRIDVVSRIIFPLVFAVFNLAYWSTYLNQEGKESKV